MNPEAKEYFNKILEKRPEALTDPEKGFLRARRSYLNKSQVDEYKDVLEAKTVVVEPTRKELDSKAIELGIENPEKLPNKQAVIDAIKAKE